LRSRLANRKAFLFNKLLFLLSINHNYTFQLIRNVFIETYGIVFARIGVSILIMPWLFAGTFASSLGATNAVSEPRSEERRAGVREALLTVLWKETKGEE
jgi:hypothetical protein